MKIRHFFILMLCSGLFISSCKDSKSDEIGSEGKTANKGKALNFIPDATVVEWTAYKTNDRIPVKGKFNKAELKNTGTGNTIEEFLNGTEFSIDTFNLSTDDAERDEVIRNSFFAVMNPAGTTSGKFLLEDDNWFVNLRLNGIELKIPISVEFSDKKAHISTNVNIFDFKAEKALNNLNNACKDLHTGPDGKSKTWDEIDVDGFIYFE